MFDKEYRLLSFVPRWGIAPRLTQQSVAEHCYYVALYASQICDILEVPADIKYSIVGYALRHDAYEVWTSDMPGPGKRFILDEAKMTAYIEKFAHTVPDYRCYAIVSRTSNHSGLHAWVIKTADLIDEMFYLCMEKAMGNTLIEGVMKFSGERLIKQIRETDYLTLHQKDDFIDEINRQIDRLLREGARIPAMED